MNKIYQKITVWHPQYRMMAGMGDCHAASLASLLEIPLESIPLDIRTLLPHELAHLHYIRLNRWLKKRFGLELITVDANFIEKQKYYFLYQRQYLAILKYHTTHHSVVCYSSSIVHDPSPFHRKDHQGITHYEFLVKFHPTIYYGVQRVDPEHQRCRELLFGPRRYVNVTYPS